MSGAAAMADHELIEAASEAIRKRYRYDWQEVGAALRTRSGKVFTGVSLDAYLGRMAVCAEAVALGQAITDRRRDRHRDHRRGAASAARREGPRHRGGVALRRLPRADLGLRSQRPRHRAGARRPETVGIGELLPNKYSRERGTEP